jgi:hypothetical protein
MLNHHDFETLKKELGARDVQVGGDFLRTGIPGIFMLVLVAAMQQALKED